MPLQSDPRPVSRALESVNFAMRDADGRTVIVAVSNYAASDIKPGSDPVANVAAYRPRLEAVASDKFDRGQAYSSGQGTAVRIMQQDLN